MDITPNPGTLSELRELVRRQAATSAGLTRASSLIEIARAIAANMLTAGGQFVTVNLAEYDEQNHLARLRTVASASRSHSFETDLAVDLTQEDLGETLRLTLESQGPAVVNDVENNTTISRGFRDWLRNFNVKALVSLPMWHAGQMFGTISINSTRDEIRFSEDELLAFQSIADQVGGLIHARQLVEESSHSQDISERRARAFEALNSGQDFVQMTAAVARHMLPEQGRFLSLSKFMYDAQGGLSGWRILASANRERSYDWNYDTLDWEGLAPRFRQSVVDGKPYVINDMSTISPSEVGPAFYALFASNGVKSFMNIPMLIDGKPVAAMGIASRVAHEFTREEVTAFDNLGEQIGALIHTRALLDEAQAARDIANNLVLASRLITTAQNYDDMAQAVMYTVARNMSAVSLSLFDRRYVPGTMPAARTITAIGTTDGPLTFEAGKFSDAPPGEAQLEMLRRGLPVMTSDFQAANSPLSDETQAQFARLGATWFGSFGLRAGDQLIGTLDLLHSQAQSFTPEEVDAYSTLADQIAITLENRNLLSQTEETLAFVQTQFEATSKIYNARLDAEILDAIYAFLGTDFRHAHLGLVENDAAGQMVRIATEINFRQITAVPRRVALETYPAAETLSALETLYIPDVARDTFITEAERERLRGQDIRALLIAPLVSNQRLIGLIVFMHPEPRVIDQNRLRALRIMADQVAVVFENRALLKSTAETLEETQILYQVNQAILASQDTLDVLRALRTHLAPEAAMINHLTNSYDDNDNLVSVVVDFVSTQGGEQVVEFPMHEVIGAERLGDLQKFWHQNDRSIGIIEDMEQADESNPIVPFSRMNDVKSYVSIPIFERGRIREAITLTFNYAQQFTQQQRRLYETLPDQISIVLQSHRLLRDAQLSAAQLGGQVRVLETINQLTTAISGTQDEKELLDHAARALVEATGVDHCGIVFVNPAETTGSVVSEHPAIGTLGMRIEINNNEPFDIVRSTRRPFVVNDIDNEPRLIQSTRDSLKKLGFHALGFFPIFVYDTLYGSAGLDITTPGKTITPQMVETAQTILGQVAVSLENIRLLKDSQRRAEQLQRITVFSQSVQATLDMATIFNIMLTESAQMLTQDQMSIAVYDAVQGKLRSVAQHADGLTNVNLNSNEIIPISGYIAKVWDKWELIHIPDVRASGEKVDPSALTRSWIVAPLISRGRILGVVSVGSIKPHIYSDTDVAVFQQMVNQLAVAIENAEAFAQSQRVAKNESLVNDISTQLQRQLDLHSMLDVTVNELGRALGARRARIQLGTTQLDEE